MSKRMLVNAAQAGEIRVAIVDGGIMEDLSVATKGAEQIKGNIYRARVVSVEAGLQAAFVDYGAERNGFIAFGDINERFWSRRPKGDGRPRIQDCVERGGQMMVQAYKEEMGNKGAAVTSEISLPGRYLVLMPGAESGGISRKIEDEDVRKTLKEIIKKLAPPDDIGIIVRTAGMGASRQEMEADFQNLMRVWGHIQHSFDQRTEPGLVYQEQDVVIRSVRDYYTDDIDEVVADDVKVHQQITDFFQRNMPGEVGKVKLYSGKMPIFSNFGLERQLENIVSPRVPLKSGGSIVVSPTEALIAIDVNSGKSKGQDNPEDMAFQTNQEAAEEVARQLRLRDLGGLIVVDFIDMHSPRHRREVEKALTKAMKLDKARVEIGRVSQFGLLELSRQRIKARLISSTHKACPMCEGSGFVLGTETAGLSILRRLQELAVSAADEAIIRGRLPVDVALFLLNDQREALSQLESEFNVTIQIIPDPSAVSSRDAVEIVRSGQGEKQPDERRERKDRKERRDRRPTSGKPSTPPARAQSPAATPAPHAAQSDGDDEEDDVPYEAPRIVGYIAPDKLSPTSADDELDAETSRGSAKTAETSRGSAKTAETSRGSAKTAEPSRGSSKNAEPTASAPASDDGDTETDSHGRRRRRRRRGRGEGATEVTTTADTVQPAAPEPVVAPESAAPSGADEDRRRRDEARARNRARRESGGGAEEIGRESGRETELAAAPPQVSRPAPAQAPPRAPIDTVAVAQRVKQIIRGRLGKKRPVSPPVVVPVAVAAAPAPQSRGKGKGKSVAASGASDALKARLRAKVRADVERARAKLKAAEAGQSTALQTTAPKGRKGKSVAAPLTTAAIATSTSMVAPAWLGGLKDRLRAKLVGAGSKRPAVAQPQAQALSVKDKVRQKAVDEKAKATPTRSAAPVVAAAPVTPRAPEAPKGLREKVLAKATPRPAAKAPPAAPVKPEAQPTAKASKSLKDKVLSKSAAPKADAPQAEAAPQAAVPRKTTGRQDAAKKVLAAFDDV
ncbi:MAG: ribonuclease E/G [Myxococcales bacterium]|nr:ribonuclease E/G [Myxococcales bacterium]